MELPFSHIKRNLRAGQFLLRGLEGVRAERALLSTCFNMARMITLLGIPEMIHRVPKEEKNECRVSTVVKHQIRYSSEVGLIIGMNGKYRSYFA